jgi:hypothetical protein
MEARDASLRRVPHDLLGRSQAEAPFDGASIEQPATHAPTDQQPRERMRPADYAADNESPFAQERVAPPRQTDSASFATSPSYPRSLTTAQAVSARPSPHTSFHAGQRGVLA